MSDKPDGGPAFPLMYLSKGTKIEDGVLHIEMKGDNGMSMRDYFAGQALAGFLANKELCENATGEADRTGSSVISVYALSVYAVADAMIAARAK